MSRKHIAEHEYTKVLVASFFSGHSLQESREIAQQVKQSILRQPKKCNRKQKSVK